MLLRIFPLLSPSSTLTFRYRKRGEPQKYRKPFYTPELWQRYMMKIGIAISYILKALMVVLILIAATRGQWSLAISGTLALLICMLPAIVNRRYDVALPLALDCLITLALLIHIGGQVTRAYFILPHYDTIAHFTSGALIAFMAFIVIYVLDKYWYCLLYTSPSPRDVEESRMPSSA